LFASVIKEFLQKVTKETKAVKVKGVTLIFIAQAPKCLVVKIKKGTDLFLPGPLFLGRESSHESFSRVFKSTEGHGGRRGGIYPHRGICYHSQRIAPFYKENTIRPEDKGDAHFLRELLKRKK